MTTGTRRDFARLLAGASIGAGGARRPNFVFILADDQRWDSLGAMGHPFLKTPNIDRIAREGALFRNFFVTTPLCSPSRASFLTGQYVHTHGVRDNSENGPLSHRLVTWPRLLHDAGYECAYIGKWHMGSNDTPRPGFDHWVSFAGQGRYDDPPLNINGKREAAQGYLTDILNDHAIEFLNRPHDRPFALYLAHKAVHGPQIPAERHREMYEAEPLTRRPNCSDSLENKPALRRMVDGKPAARLGVQPDEQIVRNQLRTVLAVDEGVGRIFQALAAGGRLDDTVLVYTSDNGYFWGEHTLGDKRWAYEESIRDPLFIRYPRVARAGSGIDAFALNVDLAPTMLELAGVRVPGRMQGRSLVPLLRGAPEDWRASFLIEYFEETRQPRTPTWLGVRGSRWKYIRYTTLEGMDELYDLASDPYEMRNLIADPSSAGALRAMRAELAHLLAETGGPHRF